MKLLGEYLHYPVERLFNSPKVRRILSSYTSPSPEAMSASENNDIIITSPNGTRYKVMVSNDGILSTEPI